MNVATASPADAASAVGMPPEPVVRFSVDEYHAMARSGILEENAPVELLEGWLVPKMTKHPRHDVSLGCIADALADLIDSSWHVRSQGAVTTHDSEPEPDVLLARGRRRDYTDRHPEAADAAIVIEVADSSLARDRGWKKQIYASAGFAEYWIVNLVDDCVEVFTEPSGHSDQPGYASQQVFDRGSLIPVRLDGRTAGQVAVEDVLP